MEVAVRLRGSEVEEAIRDYIVKNKLNVDLARAGAPVVICDGGAVEENIRTVDFVITIDVK